MTTLWDTTGSAVVKELAAQRRTGGAVLSGVAEPAADEEGAGRPAEKGADYRYLIMPVRLPG